MGLFQHPGWLLWALAAAAASALLAAWSEARRRRLLEAFARPQTLKRLFDESAAESRRLKTWLEASALCLLLAALAGPQWGVELVETRNPGSQAVIVVDTSLSMLAEDIKPNRMEKAKNALSGLIDGLKGSRVGIVAFAAEAYVQCPLTTDLDAAKSFLRRVQVGMVPQAGTDLSKAILTARAMLERASGTKSILLLSDGEDLAGKPQAAAAEAAQAGIRIFLIGTGTPEGEPIPIKDAEGRLLGYKKGPDGQTVVSKLNEQGMMEVAAASGGAYYRATQSEDEVAQILKQLEGGGSDGTGAGKGTSTRMRNRYRLPLLAAILLLLVELSLMEGASLKPSAPPPAVLAAAVLFLVAWSPKKDAKLWKGNKAYQKGSYEEAFERYAGALKKGDKDPKPLFNAGDALYKMGDYDKAAESFQRLADPRFNTRETAAAANYNLGNALAKKGRGEEAVEAYRRCLLLDMKDEACRHNLALLLQNPPPPQQQQDEQKDKKDKGGGGGGQDKKKTPPKPQQPQKKPQEQKGGMTKEDAERILQAIKEREKQAKPVPVQPKGDKDEKPGEDW